MSESCCGAEKVDLQKKENTALKKVFIWVLVINLGMFVVEVFAAYLAHSNALLADSLDMLGDVLVYALSLLVLAKSEAAKIQVSLVKASIMAILALLVLGEAVNKILNPVLPVGELVTGVGVLALFANVICLLLLLRHRHTDLNVSSAWICSRNDVVANIGVILAGTMVFYFETMWPDVVVGILIACMVLVSSVGIVREALQQKNTR